MAQYVGFALLIGASCLPLAKFSDSTCGRGTYLGGDSAKCTKCPEQAFMDEENHKHNKCKDCRTINKNHLDNMIDLRECNATHDLYFRCHPTHYVALEDPAKRIFECSMCQNCSNGQSFTTLPCDGVNDTLCCASDDMVAEVKGDGKYACAPGPSTKMYTTMPTSKSSDGAIPSNNGYAGEVTSQTSNQYDHNATASSDNSGRNEHDGWLIPSIVVSIIFIIILIIIIVVCCLAKRKKITVRKYLTGCCTRDVESADPAQTAKFIKGTN